MKTGWKVAVAIVAVVVIVAVIAAVGSGDDSPEVRYDYGIEVADSFTSSSGYEETPSSGNQYVIVTWTVANDSYGDGFHTNDLFFQAKVVAGGVAYGTSIDMYTHPGYLLGDILEGERAMFVYVYEVPAGTLCQELSILGRYRSDYSSIAFSDRVHRRGL